MPDSVAQCADTEHSQDDLPYIMPADTASTDDLEENRENRPKETSALAMDLHAVPADDLVEKPQDARNDLLRSLADPAVATDALPERLPGEESMDGDMPVLGVR